MNLFDDLKERGLVKDVTHENELISHLEENSITLYCGFDPTADSLHVGSLLPLVTLMRFSKAGHHPVALIGGATGMIGDPSGKSAERSLNDTDTVKNFSKAIESQINKITSIKCIDNNDWTSGMSVLCFLRDVGKHFSVNAMIQKESVKQRISRHDQGISFTEFSYSLLQSMDFMHLHKNENCTLQIGGSDQWGNITSGMDLIRKTSTELNSQVFGMTIPLITKSDGNKFGKSEKGNIWLSPNKTSPFKFFQFWLRTEDSDVIKFLKFFTFLTLDQISEIEATDLNSNTKPIAQRILAENLTKLVHGEDGLETALRITNAVFSNDFSLLKESDFEQLALDGFDFCEVSNDFSIVDILIMSNLATSKRQAREFINNKAVSINFDKNITNESVISEFTPFFNKWFFIKRGKQNSSLVKIK